MAVRPLLGFSNETYITGMLEASDYEALDMVSTFIGTLVDRLCRFECGLIAKAFTLHDELLKFVHLKGRRPDETESNLQILSKNIVDFRREAYRGFASYQT